MPARVYKVGHAATIADLAKQINSAFALISKDLSLPTAFDGETPVLGGDLDAGGKRIFNVGSLAYKNPSPVTFQRSGYRRQQTKTTFVAGDVPDAAHIAAALSDIAGHLADLELALEKLNVFMLPKGE